MFELVKARGSKGALQSYGSICFRCGESKEATQEALAVGVTSTYLHFLLLGAFCCFYLGKEAQVKAT